MIHFDTNLLIASVDGSHRHHSRAKKAVATGQPIATSSVAWTEFLSKPVPDIRVNALLEIMEHRVLPFSKEEAEMAARLFQLPGVNRAQRLDTMIAATAIVTDSQLATANETDFTPFLTKGLRLFSAEAS